MDKKNKRNKIIKWILNVFLGLLIALVVYLVIEVITGFIIKKPPCIFNHYIFIVVTDSMEDTIMVGEVVFIRRASFSEVNVNDIISFLDINPKDAVYGQYITHRVVGINSLGELITKGDNNFIEDAITVKENNFLGIMDGQSAFLGKIITALSTNVNLAFGIVIVILIGIIVMEVKNFLMVKEQAKNDEEKEKIKEEILKSINKTEEKK